MSKETDRRGKRASRGAKTRARRAVVIGTGARARGASTARHRGAAGAGQQAPLVVYVHGIGNKPREAILKCQWDRALFGVSLGDRTRMAYWVDRERYPFATEATCEGADRIEPETRDWRGMSIHTLRSLAAEDDESLIEGLTTKPDERRTLRSIARKLRAGAEVPGAEAEEFSAMRPGEVRPKILPVSGPARGLITRFVTRLFLQDVHDFLFAAAMRERMEGALRSRLTPGAGPFVVVAHSQGTMIAYDVLRQLDPARYRVPLFVTLGSPLGIEEVQDRLRAWARVQSGPLPTPACVKKWVNLADRLDPVAADPNIRGDFAPLLIDNQSFPFLNPDAPIDPHSATGYLSTPWARDAVRPEVGSDFAQKVQSFVVARDLNRDLADAPGARHEVLIQLAEPEPGADISKTKERIVNRLHEIVEDAQAKGKIAELERYVVAQLTRTEVEMLQAEFRALQFRRVWRNSLKRALVWRSSQTIQATPAQRSYEAYGRGIHWAVLDTGVNADHPHFGPPSSESRTIQAQWDCREKKPDRGAKDGNGHGTHVAAIIAGRLDRDLPLRAAKDQRKVRMAGMAPEAKLHVYKVLGDQGEGYDSWIIRALDHIASVNEKAGQLVVHGVNLSLGGAFDPEVYGCGHTPLCEELRRLWRQGVLVVLAAGNEGFAELRSSEGYIPVNIDLSIGDPANLEEAIAVGSVHKENPHTYGVSFFSSRGPTADGRLKPDLVAPGERILSAAHEFDSRGTHVEDLYVESGGTSMAAPHVSGLLAAFLSVRREFIGYPDRVKRILLDNCTDLARDPYIQGRGMPNLVKMLLST